MVDDKKFSTCDTSQKIDLEVFNDKVNKACFPRRVEHAALNYDYKNSRGLPENFVKGSQDYQYPMSIELSRAGRRSLFVNLMLTDTQEHGLSLQSYGNASILQRFMIVPGRAMKHWLFSPISDQSSALSKFEVLKLECHQFDWSFDMVPTNGLCETFSSGEKPGYQYKTLVGYDSSTHYLYVD